MVVCQVVCSVLVSRFFNNERHILADGVFMAELHLSGLSQNFTYYVT